MEVLSGLIQRKSVLLLLLALASSSMISCGGGGGGTTPPPVSVVPEPNPTPTPTAPQTLLNKSITGLVNAGVSGQATIAAAAPQSQVQSLEAVQVTAVLFSADVEVDSLITTTDANGAFRLAIAETEGQLIDRVDLTFEKDGYTIGQKSVSPTENTVVVTRLGPVNVVTQTREQLAFTASGQPAFRFALIRQPDGSIASVAGSQVDQARIASNHQTLLDMSIPADRVSSDVTSVTAKIAHFDPNDPNQVQAFPGDFVGSGVVGDGLGVTTDVAANSAARVAADGDEYRLISSVFSQVDLVDQNGDALTMTQSAGATTAASGNDPVMYLAVPVASYATITSDQNTTAAGIQVPIFVYSSGWKFAGNGTLVTFNATNGSYESFGQLPTGTVDLGLFVEIEITQGNEWIQWVNLDWPIQVSNQVQRICLSATIQYGGDGQEPFNGQLDIGLPDGGYDWPYVQNGAFRYDGLVFSANATDPSLWSINVWNQRAFRYETVDLSGVAPFTATSSAACAPTDFNDLGTITLINPRQYRLFGTATKNGAPVSDLTIFVEGTRFWDWVETDANGRYEMSVPSVPLTYQAGGVSGVVQVNNVVAGNETADDGNSVELNFELPNVAPEMTSFFTPGRLLIPATETQISASLVASAFDLDNDSLQFSWTCLPSATCSIAAAARASSVFDSDVVTFTATAAGDYEITVTVTDPEGAFVSRSSTIAVDQGNRKPVAVGVSKVTTAAITPLPCIRSLGALRCQDQLRAADTGEYLVTYFDLDGDTVTIDWDQFGCAPGVSCAFTATQTGPLNATLNDGAKTDAVRIDMTVAQNESPEILFAFALPSNILVDIGGTNPGEIILQGAALDDVAIASELWTVVSGTDITVDPVIPPVNAASATIPINTLAEGIYTATYSVTDDEAAPASRSVLIRVFSNQPPQLTSAIANPLVAPAASGTNDAAISLTAVATDAENDTLTYTWTIGDLSLTGATASIPAGSLPSGLYQANVVVSDGRNQDSGSASFRVNAAPVVAQPTEAATVTLSEIETRTLTASASDDFSDTLIYAWSVGGLTSTAPSLQIPAGGLSVGSHAGTLTVTDADGLSTVRNFTVVITARINQAPVISFPANGATFNFDNDQPISITAQASDEFSSVLTYAWTVDGLAQGSAATLSLAAGSLADGEHAGTLVVTDGDGASTTSSFTLNIQAPTNGNLEIIID